MKYRTFRQTLTTLIAIALLLIATSLSAAVPTTISYQGRLTNADGGPVADGDYQVTFSIYDAAIGGAVFWSETHPAVTVTNGLFSVLLGSITPFGVDGTANPAKAGEDAWVSISVNGGLESDPRIPLTSVPYAFSALRSDSALFAWQASRSDTADFSFGSNTSTWSDTAGWANGTIWSDTSSYAFSSGWTDTSETARSVVDGSVNNASIADGAVDSTSIADGSIALSDIGTNGATNGKIMKWNIASGAWVIADDNAGSGIISVLPGSGLSGGGSTPIVTLDVTEEGIGPQHIDTGAVRNSELAINAVAAENIQPQVIDNSKIAINTITGDRIANKTIGGGDMADSTIGWQQLKPNAVIGSRIAPNTIDTSDIGTGGVGSDEIVDGSVESVDLAHQAVNSVHIATNAIGPSHYQPESVTSNALAGFSVHNSKIQSGAVTSVKILDNTITASDLAPSSVDSAAIATYAVGSSELAPDAVLSYHISNGAVTDTKIANNAVHSGKVFDGSLVAVDFGDEPGIVSGYYFTEDTLESAAHTVASESIVVPAAGFVFVSAIIQFKINNGALQSSRSYFHLRLDSTELGGSGTYSYNGGAESYTSIPVQDVFPVGAGPHVVEVRANNIFTGTMVVDKVRVILMYFPTAYGAVNRVTTSGDNAQPPEGQR